MTAGAAGAEFGTGLGLELRVIVERAHALELKELGESEESEGLELEELKLIPADLGLDDSELELEALGGMEGSEGPELRKAHRPPSQTWQTVATLESDPTRVANRGHFKARPNETLTNTDPGAC